MALSASLDTLTWKEVAGHVACLHLASLENNTCCCSHQFAVVAIQSRDPGDLDGMNQNHRQGASGAPQDDTNPY